MNVRTLGFITFAGAPAMLVVGFLEGFQRTLNTDTTLASATGYLVFAVGWLASVLALRALYATGRSPAGRIMVSLPLLTIPLAAMQSVLDMFFPQLIDRHFLYIVTDIAWPLSMVLSFGVGIAALFARELPGWKRAVPLLCGAGLPTGILTHLLLGEQAAGVIFPVQVALSWTLLGLVLVSLAPRHATPQFRAAH
ncbi:hypothetical protein GCM10008955_24900 [Deinococcus malanensis]|uniref:DUF4386 domain-containing protein n=1 Tax=Deinococcus malanensis TaxID=1706855 RepID=A0ABQ2EX45_9DEIO|nr:hypothetical protein [Deinococcus malanensis]GGK30156.1 hypothetical protein GCM10008955_24900 [Deinococcus malanensis]